MFCLPFQRYRGQSSTLGCKNVQYMPRNKCNTFYRFCSVNGNNAGCNMRCDSILISKGCFDALNQTASEKSPAYTATTQKLLLPHKYASEHALASTHSSHVHVNGQNTQTTFQGSDKRLKVFGLPKNLWSIYGRHPKSA